MEATLRPLVDGDVDAVAVQTHVGFLCAPWSLRGFHTAHGYTPTRLYPTRTGDGAKATGELIATEGKHKPLHKKALRESQRD